MSDYLFIDTNTPWELERPEWLSFDPKIPTIISNEPQGAEVYAPEINWYLKHSQSSAAEKLRAVRILYEARGVRFDHASHAGLSVAVGATLLVAGDSQSAKAFGAQAEESGFEVETIPYEEVEAIEGRLGEFEVSLRQGEVKRFAQVVLFKNDELAARYKGVELVSDFENPQELLALLQSRLGEYRYKEIISYNASICQYHHRREKSCAKCASLCPTFGIVNDDSKMELLFSAIDCIACGACVSTCPSGAIDFAPYPKEALYAVARFYANSKILVIEESRLDSLSGVALPEGVVPLLIQGEKHLSEMHLLTLLQESGSSLVAYLPELSVATKEAIALLNEVYERAYGEVGIHLASDIASLQEALPKLKNIEYSTYKYTPNPTELRRKVFGERLRYVIKDKDLGTIPSGEWVRYGEIKVDQDRCTLCLSCVGACNVNALMANSNAFTLDFNASLCTTCGYCVPSCPEQAITLELSGIALNPSWFETKVMAKDEMFKCVECGVPFATKKSVEKIKTLMAPIFFGNPFKLKSLECCSDCKVKVMMGFHHEAESKSMAEV